MPWTVIVATLLKEAYRGRFITMMEVGAPAAQRHPLGDRVTY